MTRRAARTARRAAIRGAYRAEYAIDDAAELVRGAFACPVCLAAVWTTLLVDAQELPVAESKCSRCGMFWHVELDLPQVLRLAPNPPPGLWVRLSGQARDLRAQAAFTDEDIGV